MTDEVLIFQRSSLCSLGSCVEVARTGDGGAVLRSTEEPGVVLRFDGDEWSAFCRGVAAGEFGPIG